MSERAVSQPALTDQEWRIACAVGAGSSNKAVARDLALSIKTVEFHLGNVYRKLGIATRAELANLVGGRSSRIFDRSPTTGNLPRERSTLIGREDALAHVSGLLTTWPLVTLTGVGGVGKTQLALAAGRHTADGFSDGVWIVELGSLSVGRDVPTACAIALGLSSRSSTLTASEVATALGRQRRLVILDNCEHLLDGAAALAQAIVVACPHVVVLATSRERLNIADEYVFTVPPVSFIRTDDLSPAAQLFVERAQAVVGSFNPTDHDCDALDELCRRLDGLPLAIELAAARLVGLSIHEIHDRLDDRFELLTRRRVGSGRHHSLLTTIEWSYDLLSADEQLIFEGLAVFVGDFDANAAIAVSDPLSTKRNVEDCLASLVEKSMVVATEHPTGRRYALLETIREFASRRLEERGDEAAVRRRHLDHFRRFLHRANAEVRGPDELTAHLAILAEWHNLRVAVANACAFDDGPVACELINDLLWWAVTRMRAEVGEWSEWVRLLSSTVDLQARIAATAGAAFFAYMRGDVDASQHLVAIARAEELRFGEHSEPWVPAVEVFVATDPLATTRETQRRARQHGSKFWETLGILQETILRSFYVSSADLTPDALIENMSRINEAVDMAEQLGNPNDIAYGARNLGGAIWKTDPDRAQLLLEQALATALPLGLELLAGQARGLLAVLHTSRGRPWPALRIMTSALRAHIRAGAVSELAVDLAPCAHAFFAVGNLQLAKLIVVVVRATDAEVDVAFGLEVLESRIATSLTTAFGEHSTVRTTDFDLVEVAGKVIEAVDAVSLDDSEAD